MDGWRLSGLPRTARLHLLLNGMPALVEIAWGDDGKRMTVTQGSASTVLAVTQVHLDGAAVQASVDGQAVRAVVAVDAARDRLFVSGLGGHLEVTEQDLLRRDPDEGTHAASLAAPMSGRIVRLFVGAGDQVKKGDHLLVLEAMKMEHAMSAGFDAVVKAVGAGEGEQVEEGRVLVVLEAADEALV